MVMGAALGWATAGLVGGYLIEAIGYGAVLFFGAMTGVISAVALIGLLRAPTCACVGRNRGGCHALGAGMTNAGAGMAASTCVTPSPRAVHHEDNLVLRRIAHR